MPTQNQFDSLVLAAFNTGMRRQWIHKIIDKLNTGHKSPSAGFPAKGRVTRCPDTKGKYTLPANSCAESERKTIVLKGLVYRRGDEKAIFDTPDEKGLPYGSRTISVGGYYSDYTRPKKGEKGRTREKYAKHWLGKHNGGRDSSHRNVIRRIDL